MYYGQADNPMRTEDRLPETNEDGLVEFGPIYKQVRKLSMDAMRRGDKKSNLAYNKVRDILASAPKLKPMVQGQWIKENKQTLIPVEYDNNGNPILHDYVVYRCDQCGRTAGKKEPYCHCGAQMNLEVAHEEV